MTKLRRLSFRLHPTAWQQVAHAAKREGVSMSVWVARVVHAKLHGQGATDVPVPLPPPPQNWDAVRDIAKWKAEAARMHAEYDALAEKAQRGGVGCLPPEPGWVLMLKIALITFAVLIALFLFVNYSHAQSATFYFRPDGTAAGSAYTDRADPQETTDYFDAEANYRGESRTDHTGDGSTTDFYGADGDYEGTGLTSGEDEP